MIKQQVIRTWTPSVGYDNELDTYIYLRQFLEDGWIVVMCNSIKNEKGREWLEYILQKEVEE